MSPESYGVGPKKKELSREIQSDSRVYNIVTLLAFYSFIEFLNTVAKIDSTFFTVGSEVMNPNHYQEVSLY